MNSFERHFVLSVTEYTKYAESKIKKLEAEKALMQAKLDAFRDEDTPALYLEECDSCDFFFIGGEHSCNEQMGPTIFLNYCNNCDRRVCDDCFGEQKWRGKSMAAPFIILCPECI